MKIRYLIDGISKVSDNTEVVAEGANGVYVLEPCKRNNGMCLKAIPEKCILVKIHTDSRNYPPFIHEFLEYADLTQIKHIDYSLAELVRDVH